MRTLLVAGPTSGGMGVHVAALAAGLVERDWEVAVAAPDPSVLHLGEGIRADALDVGRPSSPASARASLRTIRRLRRLAGTADVVHAHGLTAGWLAWAALRGPLGRARRTGGAALVVSVHNLVLDEVEGRRAGVLRRLEGHLPARADAVIAVSDAVARRFAGARGAGRVHVVAPVSPAPVPRGEREEVRAALGVGEDEALLVTVARLHAQKDLDTLLTAMAAVHAARPGTRLVVAGEGPERARLQAEVEGRGLSGAVDLLGHRDDVADLLAAADVVVATARWESVGLAVLDAMRLGRPVVTTATGAAARLVVDGRSGRLVPVGDAPAVAAAVLDVLAEPSRARALGEGAARAVRGTGGDALVDGVVQVYAEALGTRR